MKIFVTGTRGIPDIPGGVEKHCQELYPRIVEQGHEVLLATRKPYVVLKTREWQGVRLVHCFTPKAKCLEAIAHTFVAVLKARLANPDIVHIHAVGPSLMAPFARFLGLKVVVTNHGPDYARQKWGTLAKKMLRLGEYLGARWANEVIAISRGIVADHREKYRRETSLIHNGVPRPRKCEQTDFLAEQGIQAKKYILTVARFVPEKGLHDLIEAFTSLPSPLNEEYQLVIAGDADHETPYSKKLKEMAARDQRIKLTGYITGETLAQVYGFARLFVLPSYHEGLPIALLEAMSYGLPALVSDIPANLEVGLPAGHSFRCGEPLDLSEKMAVLLGQEQPAREQLAVQEKIREKYDWQKIALQTVGVYRKALAEEEFLPAQLGVSGN